MTSETSELKSSHLSKSRCGAPHRGLSRTRDRFVNNLFGTRVPVESFSAPVGLRGHNANNRMRKSVIHMGVGLGARLHGLQPIHHVDQAVVVGLAGFGRRSS